MPTSDRVVQPLTDQIKQSVADSIEAERDRLIQFSHTLAANPETAWQEHASADLLRKELEQVGFSVRVNAGGLETALHATAGAGSRHLAVIAEYDALPGLGHACGHNVIAASALGVAVGMRDHLDALDITLHVIGTPAEEGGGGKILMMDAGEFDGLDAAMMIHPGPTNSLYARPYAVAHWHVAYHGFGAHAAAYPELGINAADAFTIAQVALGLLRQHLPSGTRIHGIVTEAGTAANAIPSFAEGTWYVRAANLHELDQLCERVRNCFEAGALATGTTLTIEETSPRYADFRTDEALASLFDANARARGSDMDSSGLNEPGMSRASTDMGNVSQRIPSIHPYIGIDSLPAVNHQPEFAAAAVAPPADQAIVDAATIMAWTIVDIGAA